MFKPSEVSKLTKIRHAESLANPLKFSENITIESYLFYIFEQMKLTLLWVCRVVSTITAESIEEY